MSLPAAYYQKKILINEIFLSIQGESINTTVDKLPLGVGTPTIFIRTHGCDVRCTYCDTKYSFDGSEHGTNMTIEQIINKCDKLSQGVYKQICITGGEPGIQKNISYLIAALGEKDYVIGVETSGSVDIRKFYNISEKENETFLTHVDSIIMDWKGPSAGFRAMSKMLEANWEYLSSRDQVKFLIKDRIDWDFMIDTLSRLKVFERKTRPIILVSPVFDDKGNHNAQQVIKWLLKSKLPLVLNLQIHKLIWDVNKRGV